MFLSLKSTSLNQLRKQKPEISKIFLHLLKISETPEQIIEIELKEKIGAKKLTFLF